MRENAEQMRKRHDLELETLQKACKHPKISKWMPYMWAPGHFGGDVKVCGFCGKIVKRKGLEALNMFKVVKKIGKG